QEALRTKPFHAKTHVTGCLKPQLDALYLPYFKLDILLYLLNIGPDVVHRFLPLCPDGTVQMIIVGPTAFPGKLALTVLGSLPADVSRRMPVAAFLRLLPPCRMPVGIAAFSAPDPGDRSPFFLPVVP